MTSVNTRQQTPHTVGYEMSPKPTPIRYEDSAEANAQPAPQPDSAAPRSPMTAEQRGPFSTHAELVNPKPSQGTEPGLLAELTQKNQVLRGKLEALVATLMPMIERLQTQIAELTQQLDDSENAPKETPVMAHGQPKNLLVDEQNVSTPQIATPEQVPPAPETQQSQGLNALIRENTEFREMVSEQLKKLTTLIEGLQQQIEVLTQRINAMGLPHSHTPVDQADTSFKTEADTVQQETLDAKPEAPETKQGAELVPTTETAAPDSSTVEALRRENEQLEAGLDRLSASYQQTISQLEQQVKSLTEKVNAQKK